jgi:hypothetical protein
VQLVARVKGGEDAGGGSGGVWSSSAVSMLRRHGGLSAVAAGRAVLDDDAGHGVLEKLSM